ncbi:hypothetical protein ACWEOI_12715 [Nocardia sp. NPDC004340]
MGTIDDWYQNRSHRGDLDPRRDFENDDVHDRLQFGELPQPDWLTPPDRSRDQRQPSAQPAKRKTLPAGGPGNRRRVQTAPAMPRWEAFVRRWLTQNPRGSNSACWAAAREAGFEKVSTKSVSRIRRAMAEDAYQHRERQRRLAESARAAEANKRASAANIRRKRAAARLDIQKAAEAIARKKAREREQANSSSQKRQNSQKPTNRVKPLRPPLNADRLGTPSRDYGPRCPACDMVPNGPTGLCRCS